MRQIFVTKKVKVVTGTALIVNIKEETIDRVEYTVRDTGYPEVALQEDLEEGLKVASILSENHTERQYRMPLEAFITACEQGGYVVFDPVDGPTYPEDGGYKED